MSWNWYVTVTPEVQQSSNHCAPAAAQMLLSAFSAPLPSQDTLFPFINSAPQTDPGQFFMGSPDGVAAAVNHFAHPPTTRFANVRTLDAAQSCTQIVRALSDLRTPAGVLVFGGGHWVVVNGVSGTGDPWQEGYAIDQLSFYNSDDGCFGGIPGAGTADEAYASERMTYAAFLDLYFFAVGADGSGIPPYTDHRNFAIVTDRATAAIPAPMPAPPAPLRYLPEQQPRQPLIDELRIEYAPDFDGDQQAALIVQTGCGYYSLVPFVNSTMTLTSLLCVDMATSYMGGMFGFPGTVTSPAMALDLAHAYRLRKPLEDDHSDRLGVRHPLRLMWRPCKESSSPFNPFYVVTGKHHHERLYVSLLGGVVSERLHHHATGDPLELDM
jgi:hypothetical protein